MHRQPLLELLNRYTARYPDEAEVAARIRQLVQSSPACFERTCRPGHVTGSAWVLSHDGQRCLLVHHAKLDRWLQPGGHADGEVAIAEVALREVREETGLADLELPHHRRFACAAGPRRPPDPSQIFPHGQADRRCP